MGLGLSKQHLFIKLHGPHQMWSFQSSYYYHSISMVCIQPFPFNIETHNQFRSSFARDDLEPEEYEETKHETIEQLREFNTSLSNLKGGNMTLVDELNRMQLVRTSAAATSSRPPPCRHYLLRPSLKKCWFEVLRLPNFSMACK